MLGAFLLFGACTGTSPEAAKKEALTLHDEAMLLMSPLKGAQRELKTRLSEWDTTGGIPAEYKSCVQTMEEALRADQQMMAWMQAFAPPAAASDSELLAHYAQKKQEMERVLKEMQEAIANSGKCLQ
jgi:polyhydroxyalkanoate synthesis regulator protein